MGNFHCISSNCARVVWREYLPPVVRWRYPDEEWLEIEADNYSVDPQIGKCYARYRFEGTFVSSEKDICGNTYRWRTQLRNPIDGKIVNYEIDESVERRTISLVVTNIDFRGIQETRKISIYPDFNEDDRLGNVPISKLLNCRNRKEASVVGKNVKVSKIYRTDGQPDDCGKCTFTITNQGKIVHEEMRDVCPEVEKLPCRLSDEFKELKIDKVPFLSSIEVTPFDNDAIRIKGIPFPLKGIDIAPSECLNIYRNELFDPLPSGNPEEPNEPAFGDFIQQICSSPTCPPPEYNVICDCKELIKCPSGTCAVLCGELICCHGSDGGIEKIINTDDYFDQFFPNNRREAGS